MRILNPRFPKEKKAEIISTYLTGDNSYEELSDYYKVSAATIRGWVSRYRKRKKVVSLQPESKPVEDMARKKKEAEKSPEVLLWKNSYQKHPRVSIATSAQSALPSVLY